MFSLPYFENQLVMYVTSDEKSTFDSPFDISKIPVVSREEADAEDRTKKLTATTPSLKPPKVGPTKGAATGAEAAASATATAQRYAQELMQIEEMKEFGSVLKSSIPVELTEAETEYVVSVVKHIFKEHIVLQYDVKNTLPDTVLENVSVVAQPADEEELEEVFILQAEKLPTDEPGKVYVAFRKVNGEGSLPVSQFSNMLKFTSKEIDPSTGEPEEMGYEDEYEVAEFELSGSDYVIPTFASNFSHIWEQVGAAGEEAQETMQLSGVKSLAGKFGVLRGYPCVVLQGIRPKTNPSRRRNGTAPQGAISPGTRGHGRACQPDHAHAEAARKDGERRASGGEHPDGLLGQVWCYNEDCRAKRGGGCCGVGGCLGCLSLSLTTGGSSEQVFMGWRWKNEYMTYLSPPHPDPLPRKGSCSYDRLVGWTSRVHPGKGIYSHNSCIKLSSGFWKLCTV